MLVRADGVSYWCTAELTAIFFPVPAGLTHFPCHKLASSSSDDILLFSIQTPLADFVQSPLCFQLWVSGVSAFCINTPNAHALKYRI